MTPSPPRIGLLEANRHPQGDSVGRKFLSQETHTSEARAVPPKFLVLLTAACPAVSGSEPDRETDLELALILLGAVDFAELRRLHVSVGIVVVRRVGEVEGFNTQRSVMRKSRCSAASKLLMPGPDMMLRPALPSVFCAGIRNADMSKYF